MPERMAAEAMAQMNARFAGSVPLIQERFESVRKGLEASRRSLGLAVSMIDEGLAFNKDAPSTKNHLPLILDFQLEIGLALQQQVDVNQQLDSAVSDYTHRLGQLPETGMFGSTGAKLAELRLLVNHLTEISHRFELHACKIMYLNLLLAFCQDVLAPMKNQPPAFVAQFAAVSGFTSSQKIFAENTQDNPGFSVWALLERSVSRLGPRLSSAFCAAMADDSLRVASAISACMQEVRDALAIGMHPLTPSEYSGFAPAAMSGT